MSLTLSQLATHVAKALAQNPRQQVLAYAWPHAWAGGESILVDGRTLPLRYCESVLEVREALSRESDSPQILLVGLAENKLGQDVLARFVQHRLLHVDRWQLVQEVYGVRQVDPRLFALHWMPPLLLDALPSRRQATSPVLSYMDAMGTCLSFSFGLAAEQPSLEDLAVACEANTSRWLAIPQEQRGHFRSYLVSQLGPLADVFVSAMENGTGHAIVATGLACEVLYADEGVRVQELRDARIRLESRLGGRRLEVAEGRRWAELAVSLVERRSDRARLGDERVATDLLDALGAAPFISLSGTLSAGLDARLSSLGEAIDRFLRSSGGAMSEVEAAAARVHAHRVPPAGHPGPEAARMAVRLCRSLVRHATPPEAVGSVAGYLSHGAWQDWARRTLRGVRPEAFARSVKKLLDRVTETRRTDDQAFATTLLAAMRLGDLPKNVIPIESALDTVVAPLAQYAPVLLVVLDGMSMDVSLAIEESLSQRGWVGWSQKHAPPVLLATVPSVTELSRSTLLSGRLARGVARQETQAFTAHDGLRRVCREARPPLLFHKAGVADSHQMSQEVADAISDPLNRVVAVVINAIDDTLAKSEQIRIDWDLESIPLLAEVVDKAQRAGRTVILTSDHGHVLERDSRLVPGGVGERYRRADIPPGEGELQAEGPRVRVLSDGDIVVPWREDLRYAPKKNGYHGGVTRQEMIVPLGIWTQAGMELPESDYQVAVSYRPEWWEGAHLHEPAATVQAGGRRQRQEVGVAGDLFAIRSDNSDLAERLASSGTFARQQERVGRVALEPERLMALIRKLEGGGGRASVDQLARSIDMPTIRMRGVISVLERTLNLDGFPVITFEQATGTVLLDLALLRTQFQL